MTDHTTNPELLQYVERIERLQEDAASVADDIKDVFAEAKATGFIPAVMRKVIAERALERAAFLESVALLDLYRTGVGLAV